ncbi:hypothetical protein GC177_03350 [bacterium]|nr:hypothetical protein [bacterium]
MKRLMLALAVVAGLSAMAPQAAHAGDSRFYLNIGGPSYVVRERAYYEPAYYQPTYYRPVRYVEPRHVHKHHRRERDYYVRRAPVERVVYREEPRGWFGFSF